MKINEIKDILNDNPDEKFLNSLHNDPRKGVQTALKQYYKRVESLQKKKEAFIKRFKYEKSFWNNGIEYVAGIDEVGRGPLAGPVVACAVILPHDFNLIDVNDSKKLSEKKREELYNKILDQAVSVGIATGSCKLIDEVNIYEATRITMRNAVEKLSIKPEQLIIDAMDIDTTIPQLKLIKGDQKSISVSAASIIAKQYRDQLMKEYAVVYPGYEFEKNVGYGTKAHLKGLKELGVTPIHRLSFEPVKKNLK